MARIPVGKSELEFDPNTFLATIGAGRKHVAVLKKQRIYTQGDRADAVFYVQKGKVRLTVVSKSGKEATIGIVSGETFLARERWQGNFCAWGPPRP
jgi:CRP/FNR family transcriptional regulator, cyclic AMP receptor protein